MERQIFLAVILGFLFTLHAGVQEVHAQTENQVMVNRTVLLESAHL